MRRPAFRAFLLLVLGLSLAQSSWPWPAVLAVLLVAAVPFLPWSRADFLVAVGLVASGALLGYTSRWLDRVSFVSEEEVTVRGIALSRARRSARASTVDVVLLDRRNHRVGVRLRVHLPDTSLVVAPGDTVEAAGSLRSLQSPRNPGETDWSRLLRERGIVGRLWGGDVTVRPRGPDRTIRGRVRTHVEAALLTHAKGEEGALALAMIIGVRDLLDPAVMEGFRSAGIVHILSISGFHVGIVAALLYRLFGVFLPGYRCPSLASLVGVIGYVVIVGPHPPVLRAGAMSAVVLLGLMLGRGAEGINSLGLAGLGLLVSSPRALREPGFQLSFGATLGILIFGPPMLARLRRWGTPLRWAIGSVLTSLSAQLGVLPLLLFWFRQWPTYGLIANIPAVLLATVLIAGAMATSVADLVSSSLASWCGRLTGLAAAVLLLVSRWVAGLPGAVLQLGDWRLWLLSAGWAGVVGARVGARWGRPLPSFLVGFGCGALAWSLWLMDPWQSAAERVTFLHVPGGNCIVLEARTSWAVLDPGSSSPGDRAARVASDHLRFRCAKRLDLVGATSTDEARSAGIEALVASWGPPVVALPEGWARLRERAYLSWSSSPQVGRDSGFRLEPVEPGTRSLQGLVARSAGGMKVMVAGDGGWRADAASAGSALVESTDVLYVGPARNLAPSPLLLRRAQPRLIVLGGGTSGEEELARDLVSAGYRVARTSEGAVTVECLHDEIRWRQYGGP